MPVSPAAAEALAVAAVDEPALEGFEAFISWPNLLRAAQAAARGKRSTEAVARFEYAWAENLLRLQRSLADGSWAPGPYTHFEICEPKRRLISAAPFVDRVVHHALCQIIEPRFEAHFLPCSFANRKGLGSSRAVARVRGHCRQYRYALRLDVQQHFPNIDHAVLRRALWRRVPEPGLRRVMEQVLASGECRDRSLHRPANATGYDPLAARRAVGLPIGNLTSQFWSNCLMDGLDHFITRQLSCHAYTRYVDDMVLFSDSKAQLWSWRARTARYLAQHLRLRIHEGAAQPVPTVQGLPWLGFVMRPACLRVKSRKVVEATRRLRVQRQAWQCGALESDWLEAAVKGWVSHVRPADPWGGLRRHVLRRVHFSHSLCEKFCARSCHEWRVLYG
jgi:RNA-directed DNA polymerase